MNRIFFFLVLFGLSNTITFAQSISESVANLFVETLIHSPDSIYRFLNEQDLLLSERMGISYIGVSSKFLLSYDFSDKQRRLLQSGAIEFRYEVIPLKNNFSRLKIQLNDETQTEKEFYFLKNSLISHISYFIKEWSTIESKYFRFYSNDTTYFNSYSIQKLDRFVDELVSILKLNEQKAARLFRKKIDYVFTDSESIKTLTKYNAKGQYNLAFDAIISTYNAHFHEVAHLLLNYTLEEQKLFPHPLLQEGFAVALGGRGGLSKAPLFNFARFALENGIVEVNQFLKPFDFIQMESSVSYPVAGLLVADFIEKKGIHEFLNQYKKYSSKNREDIKTLPKDFFSLDISEKNIYEFIEILSDADMISKLPTITSKENNSILEDKDSFYFTLKDTVLINSELVVSQEFKSLKFIEVFPDRDYFGEHFLVTVNDSEIALYDLYSNELVTNYVVGFQNDPVPTRSNDSTFRFRISKEVFKSKLIKVTKAMK